MVIRATYQCLVVVVRVGVGSAVGKGVTAFGGLHVSNFLATNTFLSRITF